MKALSQKKSGIASEKIVDIGEYQEALPLNLPWTDYIDGTPASHGDEVIFLFGMPYV
ncbi:MAG: hypothetical protein ACE5GN_04100 [Waddliaceae bacterium]